MSDNYEGGELQISPLCPMLGVRDPRATIAWFEKLEFTNLGAMELPDGTVGHAMVARGPVQFMLGPAMGEVGAPGASFYITLKESVDGFYARVTAAGVATAGAPADQFWGDRTFAIVHPDGYRLEFCEHVRDVSEEEMRVAMMQYAGASA